MTKYELSISANYVGTWTIVDAIRELFQNALDEQVKDAANKLFFEYDSDKETLRIGNLLSKLDIKTLLIGETTKKDDSRFIGQHGEGYKIATLVLLREKCKVTFFNYLAREIWHTRLVKSRKYAGALVPVFDVEKLAIWNKAPEAALIIEVEGISTEHYEQIKESNLNIQPATDILESAKGTVLLSPNLVGKMFISGLYVSTNTKFKYGYNFKPGTIKLDRDRRMIRDFDLQWLTSTILISITDKDFSKSCVNLYDGYYMHSMGYMSASSELGNILKDDFISKHGAKAIPVYDQSSFNLYTGTNVKPVMMSENAAKLITNVSDFEKPKVESDQYNNKRDIVSQFRAWYNAYSWYITDNGVRAELDILIQDLVPYMAELNALTGIKDNESEEEENNGTDEIHL
jgi:hypothetical protein